MGILLKKTHLIHMTGAPLSAYTLLCPLLTCPSLSSRPQVLSKPSDPQLPTSSLKPSDPPWKRSGHLHVSFTPTSCPSLIVTPSGPAFTQRVHVLFSLLPRWGEGSIFPFVLPLLPVSSPGGPPPGQLQNLCCGWPGSRGTMVRGWRLAHREEVRKAPVVLLARDKGGEGLHRAPLWQCAESTEFCSISVLPVPRDSSSRPHCRGSPGRLCGPR